MELIPILTRAESLFRRFERTVHAIDKKNHFPEPSTARKPTAANNKGKSPATETANTDANADTRVISPELWTLLRRDIPWSHGARMSPS